MPIVTLKAVRQKLMQTAVLEKIERERLAVNTEQIRRRMRTIREHVTGGPVMAGYLNRWDQIIEGNDIDGIREVVSSDDENAHEMRNLSPLGVLLSEQERLDVLDALRRHLADVTTEHD